MVVVVVDTVVVCAFFPSQHNNNLCPIKVCNQTMQMGPILQQRTSEPLFTLK